MKNDVFKDATFNIAVVDKSLKVSRTIIFHNGNEISLTVSLPHTDNISLPEIHIKSIQAAIDNLKTLIPQQ